jgi:hypothetical protein
MADIFVSYAREDRPLVAPFIELLEKQGWSIWADWEVLPRHSFGNEIDKKIDQDASDTKVERIIVEVGYTR